MIDTTKPVVPLYPQEDYPERILFFGVGGAGKTSALLQIARRLGLRPDGQPARMYVIDTDYSASWNRLLATEFKSIRDRVTVKVVGPDDFKGVLAAVSEIKKVAKAGDWIVLDSITPTWQAVQSWFIEEVHGSQIEDYFVEVRKEAKKSQSSLGALDGWMDWPVINKMYFVLYREILGTPANVAFTAEQGAISDTDDKDVKGAFGTYGVKPVGQKKLGFVMSSNLWLTKTRVGEYRFTTIKDRGMEEKENQPVTDFGMDYLFNIAGWRPVNPHAPKAPTVDLSTGAVTG